MPRRTPLADMNSKCHEATAKPSELVTRLPDPGFSNVPILQCQAINKVNGCAGMQRTRIRLLDLH
jgi:hypothetical protein